MYVVEYSNSSSLQNFALEDSVKVAASSILLSDLHGALSLMVAEAAAASLLDRVAVPGLLLLVVADGVTLVTRAGGRGRGRRRSHPRVGHDVVQGNSRGGLDLEQRERGNGLSRRLLSAFSTYIMY